MPIIPWLIMNGGKDDALQLLRNETDVMPGKSTDNSNCDLLVFKADYHHPLLSSRCAFATGIMRGTLTTT